MNLNATDLQRLLNWHESWMEAPLRQSGFTPQNVVDENWVLRMRIREELGRVDPAGLGPLPAGFAPPPIRERDIRGYETVAFHSVPFRIGGAS